MKDLLKTINSIVSLSDNENKQLQNALQPLTLKKGEVFLKQGTTVNQIALVASGSLEMFTIDALGNERTLDFIFAQSFATDYVSYLNNTPSEMNIRALKKTEIYIIEKIELDALFDSSINFSKLGRVITEQFFTEFAKRIRDNFLPPEQRYHKLVEDKPEWIQEIPQYKIASFLGISAEWLSKLRSKK